MKPGFLSLTVSFFISLITATSLISTAHAGDKPINLVFYNSSTSDVHWWRTASEILTAAGNDLNMKVDVVYLKRNPFQVIKDLEKRVKAGNKPDVILYQNLKQNAVKVLQAAEKHKVYSFIFNAGLTDKQAEKYGGPRDKFKYWIGEMLPDDAGAGYDVAATLLKQAEAQGLMGDDGKAHFVALNGLQSDASAIERIKGLTKAVSEHPKINLAQTVSAAWDQKKANAAMAGLMKRYPNTKVVWAANDPMALGAIERIEALGKTPGKDIIVGSIDWDPTALKAVGDGKLVVSIDGHFMETAWSAVLIHDFLNNKDFKDEGLSFKSKMGQLSKDTVNIYLNDFKTENYDKVDYKQFSKVYNKDLSSYNFSFDPVLEGVSK